MDDLYNRVARRRRRGESGFTLIELLVVIAVLAILAAIVIFNIVGVANRGAKSACDSDVKTVQTAMDAWYNDNGLAWGANFAAGTYHTTAAITTEFAPIQPQYIHTVPTSCADASGTVLGITVTNDATGGGKTVSATNP